MAAAPAPAQCGGVHGSIPQLHEVVVELEQRQRRARHLERRDVAAHQPADRVEAGIAQSALDLAIEQYSSSCGVPPIPFTNGSTFAPLAAPRSLTTASTMTSAISRALPS